MPISFERHTVDLSTYPDLIVIYLGMRVNTVSGMRTLLRIGPQIARSVKQQPDGLLLHENILFSLLPPHVGMRQYWHDFDALERWTRSMPHQRWWQDFMRDPAGTGFWHETYRMRGGMEAVYGNVRQPLGFTAFAPVQEARGTLFSARKRLKLAAHEAIAAPVDEESFYAPKGGH